MATPVKISLAMPVTSIVTDGIDDREYFAEHVRSLYASVMTNGVHPNPGSSFHVSAGGGWVLQIAKGKCCIEGALGAQDDVAEITIDPPDGIRPRIDNVVLRFEPNTGRWIFIAITNGTPASLPVAPQLQRDSDAYEICLARVYVGANVQSITDADISDTRDNSSLCGRINSLIQVDADTLFAQYEAIWAQWITRHKQMTAQTYAEFAALVAQYTLDATARYNALGDQIDGLSGAAQTTYDNYADEVNAFKINSFVDMGQWTASFKDEWQATVSAWFQDYISTLGPDEAVQLFNKLYLHEERLASSESGVHGQRFWGNQYQVYFNGGWVTLFELRLGARAAYLDGLGHTCREWDVTNMTCHEFETMIEKEAG